MGEYHAGTAALCDLGDPGWGIPGFRIELLLLPTPSQEAQCVLWRVCLFCVCMGLRQHGTKDVSLHVTR